MTQDHALTKSNHKNKQIMTVLKLLKVNLPRQKTTPLQSHINYTHYDCFTVRDGEGGNLPQTLENIMVFSAVSYICHQTILKILRKTPYYNQLGSRSYKIFIIIGTGYFSRH